MKILTDVEHGVLGREHHRHAIAFDPGTRNVGVDLVHAPWVRRRICVKVSLGQGKALRLKLTDVEVRIHGDMPNIDRLNGCASGTGGGVYKK